MEEKKKKHEYSIMLLLEQQKLLMSEMQFAEGEELEETRYRLNDVTTTIQAILDSATQPPTKGAIEFLESKGLNPKLFSYLDTNENGVDIIKLLNSFASQPVKAVTDEEIDKKANEIVASMNFEGQESEKDWDKYDTAFHDGFVECAKWFQSNSTEIPNSSSSPQIATTREKELEELAREYVENLKNRGVTVINGRTIEQMESLLTKEA